jgi:hypothetical protein
VERYGGVPGRCIAEGNMIRGAKQKKDLVCGMRWNPDGDHLLIYRRKKPF